jgi:lipid II:glycine glycyltransferase (peptidoglycan interpeptide bridge formation enzyme)
VGLLRDIPEGLVQENYRDLVSPYGYAGPILEPRDEFTGRSFMEIWSRAARELGVVSEFVRFHPVLKTYEPFISSMDASKISETVVIDLASGEIRDGLSGTCRKNLKVARRKGVQVNINNAGELPRFVRLYRTTMTRRTSVGYYDFEDRYFEDLARGLGDDMWVAMATHEGTDVAGALVLRHGPYLSYHLGGSDYAQRSLCATNLLLVHIAEHGRKMGLRTFHLGGGMKAGDSLFHFKAGFSVLRGHFHVGRKIYAQKEYDELTAARKAIGRLDGSYFPAYRAPDNS